MQQTKVTDNNRLEFYKTAYPVLRMSKNQLINLDIYPGAKVVFDSAGWYYQQNFPNQTLVKVENFHTCRDYQLRKDQFDKMFQNMNVPDINLPGSTLVLDHSNYLKYKTPSEIVDALDMLSHKVKPSVILLRLDLTTVNDNRLTNRLQNFTNIAPNDYVVSEFSFSLDHKTMFAKLIKKKTYDFN